MKDFQAIYEIMKAFAWYQVVSGNHYTASFRHTEMSWRINYYHTTGTLVIQPPEDGKWLVFKKIRSILQIENILEKKYEYR